MDCTVREAEVADCAQIVAYIRRLAEFENLLHSVEITEETVKQDFFGSSLARAVFVETEGRTAGFAVYYFTYSTFAGKKSLFLEDLFIDPEFRNHGFARQVFIWLEKKARAERCRHLEWNVLAWNTRAISFYRALGAAKREEWETWHIILD